MTELMKPSKVVRSATDSTRYVRSLKLSGTLEKDAPKEKSSSLWDRIIKPNQDE